jgi:hypothetical protein
VNYGPLGLNPRKPQPVQDRIDCLRSIEGRNMWNCTRTLFLAAAALPTLVLGTHAASAQIEEIESVAIHPPVAARFQCSEHALGDVDHVPDALGADCVVIRREGGPSGNLNAMYSGDGTRNEDWHGWREPLLAPFDGVVLIVSLNPVTATPGSFGGGRSSAILFREGLEEDPKAVQVAYVHVREVTVSEGDTVRAGEPVARIGNNGNSFNPHVHIGAFRGELFSNDAVPLQVRMDLAAMGRLRGLVRQD